MMTKIQMSAELLERWAEDALNSVAAVEVLDRAIEDILSAHYELTEEEADALRHLQRARTLQGITRDVFIRLMLTEVRVAYRARDAAPAAGVL